MLTPQQLEIISDEYYLKGFVHGRNRLYTHLKSSYPNVFDSRDAIGTVRGALEHHVQHRHQRGHGGRMVSRRSRQAAMAGRRTAVTR